MRLERGQTARQRCQVALLGLSPGYHCGAFKEILGRGVTCGDLCLGHLQCRVD